MNTTSLGTQAEQLAGERLKETGYKILDCNWRRPSCEIDIIAKKDDVVYFVEVKFRRQSAQGAGLEYITHTKLKQMTHAASVWSSENDWQGDSRLMAVEVNYDGHIMTLAGIEEIS